MLLLCFLGKEVYCDEDRKPIHPLIVFLDENRYTDVTSGSLNENINISLSHLTKITFPCYGLIICKLHTQQEVTSSFND